MTIKSTNLEHSGLGTQALLWGFDAKFAMEGLLSMNLTSSRNRIEQEEMRTGVRCAAILYPNGAMPELLFYKACQTLEVCLEQ